MSYKAKDSKGRVVLYGNSKGKIALARYPDMTEEEIAKLTDLYHELSGDSKKEIEDFLRFRSKEKFCS